jgi:hypothetical protein
MTDSVNGKKIDSLIMCGIDRVDSSVGYVAGNVEAACIDCNNIKGTYSIEELLCLLMRVLPRLMRYVGRKLAELPGRAGRRDLVKALESPDMIMRSSLYANSCWKRKSSKGSVTKRRKRSTYR